jgi:hypothetical protein
MRPLSVHEMIGVWEKGDLRSPIDQALLLLHAAAPEDSISSLAKLHVGERDRRLLQLREKTFGSRFSCSVDCPWCSENLHFEFETDQILQPSPAKENNAFSATTDELDVTFRLPNSEDLVEAMSASSAEESRHRILARCLLSVRMDGIELSTDDVPQCAIEKISGLMSSADPQVDTQFGVQCSSCGKTWHVPFDVTFFFWNEISVRARRTLSEVHALASAYGWNEEEILGMSVVRREFYLQMVCA